MVASINSSRVFSNAVTPVNLPTGFSIAIAYRPNISRVGSGFSSTFTTDYDPAVRKATITPVQTIYVRLSGNNNNDGLTVGNAIRSLDLAVAMANAYGTATAINYEATLLGAARVLFKRSNTQARTGAALVNGVNVDATYTDAWQSVVPVVNLIFEPSIANGIADSIQDSGAFPTVNTTADANIYRITTADNAALFDYTNLDERGAPIRLATLLTTPANPSAPWPEMNALWTLYSNQPKRGGGTYNTGVAYRNGTNVYIRTWDNRNVTGDTNLIIVPATGTVSPILRASTASGGVRSYFMEGLGFMGGASGSLVISGDNSLRCTADLIRCRFLGGNGRGAIAIQPSQGTTSANGCSVIAVDCVASGAWADGWNVDFSTFLITINCTGDWNGWTTSTFNNGHTFHSNSRGIDVGGSYRNNQDRNVHHVHNGMNWHLGTESGTRRGADATDVSINFAINGAGNTGTRQLWIDAPRLFNGVNGPAQHNYGVWTGSTINYTNAAVIPGPNPSGWTGTIQSYTP